MKTGIGFQVLHYFRSPRVTTAKKGLALLALLYVLFPLDALPDAIPLLGWLDDLGVIGAVAAYTWRDIRRMREEDAAVRPAPRPSDNNL